MFLKLSRHVWVDESELQRGVDGDVFNKLPIRQITREAPQLGKYVSLGVGTFGLV